MDETDIYHTRVAYRDTNAWTSERGAGKFIDQMIESTKQATYGGYGCIINGFTLSSGSGMSLNINPQQGGLDGHILIKYNDYAYLGWLQSVYNLSITGSDQGLPRRTLVVAYIDLNVEFVAEDTIIESPNVLKFAAIDGTAAANPSAPSISEIQSSVGLNNPYVVLADLYIPAGSSSISLTDSRTYVFTDALQARLSPNVILDPTNSFIAGFYQAAPNEGTKTRIVITGPTASTPAAIPGVELIWIKKKLS